MRTRAVSQRMTRTARRPPGARRPPPDPNAVAQRRQRAAEESLDVRLRALEPFADLEVRNPVHRTAYRVLFPEYPQRDGALCTCNDFARRDLGTCKHVEAAWEWLGAPAHRQPPAVPAAARRPGPDVWTEIDRRLEPLSRRDPEAIRDVEQPGSILFEGSDPTSRGGGVEEKVGRGRSRRGV